jgi:hypothetical protein
MENENKMSSIERFRFILYACAIVLAVVCSPFLFFFSYYYPFEFLRLFGIDLTFGLAVLFSCAYHWRQQSKKRKILTNVGRIFFWSLVAMRALITILFVLALIGMPPGA